MKILLYFHGPFVLFCFQRGKTVLWYTDSAEKGKLVHNSVDGSVQAGRKKGSLYTSAWRKVYKPGGKKEACILRLG